MLIDFDALKGSDPSLHRIIAQQTGIAYGEHELDLMDYAPTTRRRLSDWLKAQQPEPALVVVSTRNYQSPEPTQELPEQINISAYEREQLQKATDQARGIARLNQFVEEQGLEQTPENAAKVQRWLDQNAKGYWSQQGVDAAVLNLRTELTWEPKTVAAPPPPVEPQEVLGTLRNGEPQLPLDADERTMKNASVTQLKDLVERRRKATNQQYIRRGFGAKFI